MANKGPDGFLEAQKECYRLLEDKHYHSFLTSDSYHQLIVESKKLDISFGREKSRELFTMRVPMVPGLLRFSSAVFLPKL